MSSRKVLSVIPPPTGRVVKIPGKIAFNDLLERITETGMELDPGSKLAALASGGTAPLLAHTRPAGAVIDDPVCRRRGAPLPRNR